MFRVEAVMTVRPGAFGENLGDRFRLGTALIEVTQGGSPASG